ncbi:hypothetical protein [Rhizobium leguminosarum]|nr:hypothetical protein [Rhizobium leguminosarum]
MMDFESLTNLSRLQAQGFLARAGLYLSSDGTNPAAKSVLDNEENMRAELLSSLRQRARSRLGNARLEEVDKLVEEWIDEQIEAVSEKPDEEAALERLTRDGVLPLDAYTLEFGEQYLRSQARFSIDDRALVAEATRHPDFEEQFQNPNGSVSLVGKWVNTGTPDAFFLIATLTLADRKSSVIGSWRLYPGDVSFLHVHSLPDALERFALAFGVDFQMGTERGKFIRHAYLPVGSKISIAHSDEVEVSSIARFDQPSNSTEIYFAFSVNIDRYRKMLQRRTKRHQQRNERN